MDDNVRCTILIIDDDPDDHFFISSAIREISVKINILSVYNGLHGLELLTQTLLENGKPAPDIIICDINMPRMNGIQFLEKIKESQTFNEIPVFMMSTACDDATKNRLMALGAKDCFTKPTFSINYRTIVANIINKVAAFDNL